ncbi:hypothetical protein [Bradyrhizobium icense]|nr:hypothetical protein [Bradyrhizobium icense]
MIDFAIRRDLPTAALLAWWHADHNAKRGDFNDRRDQLWPQR